MPIEISIATSTDARWQEQAAATRGITLNLVAFGQFASHSQPTLQSPVAEKSAPSRAPRHIVVKHEPAPILLEDRAKLFLSQPGHRRSSVEQCVL